MAAIPRLADSSPTASLLRNSRLFSLPQPLPRPNLAVQVNGRSRNSETATTPYPTHQVIATTDASRSRGDWGLKRSLPLRSTHAARGIRIRSLDTYDQVTDFENARDHLMTLKKLQELNLNVSRHSQGTFGDTNRADRFKNISAFELQHDNTAPKAIGIEQSAREKNAQITGLPHRWRSRGPDIRSMAQADFNSFVEQSLAGRHAEFERFLKTHLVKEHVKLTADHFFKEGDRSFDPYKELIGWLDLATLPEVERYLSTHAESNTLPQSVQQWYGINAEAETPPWMPARPSGPVSYHNFIWNTQAQRMIHDYRNRGQDGSQRVQPQPGGTNAAVDVSSLTNPIYSEEERAYVDNLITEAESELLSQIEHEIVPKWSAWFIDFRNSSGKNPSHRHLIEYFLDLPTTITNSPAEIPYLSTHPSAGLSYRRTARTLVNHPYFGPLVDREPATARILFSNSSTRSNADTYRTNASNCGLAGIVASSQIGIAPFGHQNNIVNPARPNEVSSADAPPARRGTSKGLVRVNYTTITPEGRIDMSVDRPYPQQATEAVWNRDLETQFKEDKEGTENPLSKVPTVKRATPFNISTTKMIQGDRLMVPLDSDSKEN